MIAKVAAALALVGTIATGIFTADTRYVHASDYRDFQWSVMKEQINATRERIYRSRSAEERAYWERELNDILALFCRKYPDDRECRG